MSLDLAPTSVVSLPFPNGHSGPSLSASVINADPTAVTLLIDCGSKCTMDSHTLTFSNYASPTAGWSFEDLLEVSADATNSVWISHYVECDATGTTSALSCGQTLAGMAGIQVREFEATATSVPVTITAAAEKFVTEKHAASTDATFTTPADAFATGASASAVLAAATSGAAAKGQRARAGSGVTVLLAMVLGMFVR